MKSDMNVLHKKHIGHNCEILKKLFQERKTKLQKGRRLDVCRFLLCETTRVHIK